MILLQDVSARLDTETQRLREQYAVLILRSAAPQTEDAERLANIMHKLGFGVETLNEHVDAVACFNRHQTKANTEEEHRQTLKALMDLHMRARSMSQNGIADQVKRRAALLKINKKVSFHQGRLKQAQIAAEQIKLLRDRHWFLCEDT